MVGNQRRATLAGFLIGSAVTGVVLLYFLAIDTSKKTDKKAEKALRGSIDSEPEEDSKPSETEVSHSFVTSIMDLLWDHINLAGTAMIKGMVEPMFKTLPGPLASLRFTKVDLGSVPIEMDNFVVHEGDSGEGAVRFDVDVRWDGDCDIELCATGLSFGVESIKLCGRMSILLGPLTNEVPIVSAIQYAFINLPKISLEFTGMAQVANFSMIDKTIRKIIDDILASMVVLPNRMLFKVDPGNDFLKTFLPPKSIVRITALKGRGFKVQKGFVMDDVPDVYCNIRFAANPVWSTSVIKDRLAPQWSECADFILSDSRQIIEIDAFDRDTGPIDADDELGTAKISVGEVLCGENKTAEVELRDRATGESTGHFITIQCENCRLSPQELSSLQPQKEQGERMMCGLIIVLVTRAFDLPLKKEEVASFVKVTHGNMEFLTPVVKNCPGIDAINPVFDSAFHIPVTMEMAADFPAVSVVFNLMNGSTLLGTTAVSHSRLLSAPKKSITERLSIGDQGASLEFQISLYGIQFGGLKSKDSYPQPSTLKQPRELDADVRLPVPSSHQSEIIPQPAPGSEPPLMPSKPEEQATSSTKPHPSTLQLEEPIATLAPMPSGNGTTEVRVTVIKGRGFEIQKRKFRKADIPDVYCCTTIGSVDRVWRTSTIKNNTDPQWNESSNFTIATLSETLRLDVYDEDSGIGDRDDYLGSAEIDMVELVRAGEVKSVELELKRKKQGTGSFITLQCMKLK